MKPLAGALPSLLLRLLLTSTPGALGTNPGLVARITDKGLQYVAREGSVALQKELLRITLPDFTGDFKIKPFGRGHYEFYSLSIHSCELRGSTLRPLPGQGLSLSISDSFIRVEGEWKARKAFVSRPETRVQVKLHGSFDVQVKGITISVSLVLGREPSGRPTITASGCSSHIQDVEVDISGGLGWLLNLFHNQIESKFRRVLESKVCEMLQNSVTSDLQPYLQTLPVTTEIDSFAGIDYSLMEAPRATAQMLDVMFKGEIFSRDHYSPVTFLAPVMSLPEQQDRMVYFAVSDYVFNTASLVYHESGYLNFSITDDMVPQGSNIRLTTKSFRPFVPRLARLYPNMNLELQGAMASAPSLNFSPGNLSSTPLMEIEGFVLLPSSVKEPVFRLGVATNVSAMLTFNTSRITGFLKPGKIQVELKESKVGVFNVELLEALLNYYILNTLYPKVNEKLAEGFPLPLLKDIQLYDPVLEIHKDFLFLGTNLQYKRA
ncbi:lipopolysaccharide-binding protein-like isoform X2 [Mustela lutreola]|uniref:lipopolysaccharide-binding protein-like isoform X2 n=1 Tax=Mustela lutreola TaxID=9666 RepID=UPI002797405C|nr:lipopolysaccharide-binding protein-like isoform X2 [Mustela lutreola]